MYDELDKKFDAIQTASNLVKKADYGTKVDEFEKKYLIIIIANMSLHRKLTNSGQKILLKD